MEKETIIMLDTKMHTLVFF